MYECGIHLIILWLGETTERGERGKTRNTFFLRTLMFERHGVNFVFFRVCYNSKERDERWKKNIKESEREDIFS